MIGGDRVGDVLQQHGLAGARRRDDQAALALADRRQQVHDAFPVQRTAVERRNPIFVDCQLLDAETGY
jgi:hypothetical protein